MINLQKALAAIEGKNNSQIDHSNLLTLKDLEWLYNTGVKYSDFASLDSQIIVYSDDLECPDHRNVRIGFGRHLKTGQLSLKLEAHRKIWIKALGLPLDATSTQIGVFFRGLPINQKSDCIAKLETVLLEHRNAVIKISEAKKIITEFETQLAN